MIFIHAEPDLWKNLIAQGHEVGYHGYNHTLPSSLSVTATQEDYKKWLAAAKSAIGIEFQLVDEAHSNGRKITIPALRMQTKP